MTDEIAAGLGTVLVYINIKNIQMLPHCVRGTSSMSHFALNVRRAVNRHDVSSAQCAKNMAQERRTS